MSINEISKLALIMDKIKEVGDKVDKGGLSLDEQFEALDLYNKLWNDYNSEYKRINPKNN